MFESESFNQIIAACLLAYSLLFALLSLIPPLRQQALRLFVVLTAAGLAALSEHWTTYLVALLIVAAAVTDLELMQSLAAAIRGGTKHIGYRVRTLSDEEMIELITADPSRGSSPAEPLTGGQELAGQDSLTVVDRALGYLEREHFRNPLQRNVELCREGIVVQLHGLLERSASHRDTAVEVKLLSPATELSAFAFWVGNALEDKASRYSRVTARDLEVVLALVVPDLASLEPSFLEQVQKSLSPVTVPHRLLWLTHAQLALCLAG